MHFGSRKRVQPQENQPGNNQAPVSGVGAPESFDGASELATSHEAAEPEATARHSAARSSFIMFLGTLVSRFLGMVRSPILLGAVVGVSTPVANSFDIANNVPNLLYGIIAGGLVNAVLVPAIVRVTEKSQAEGTVFINKLLTFSFITLGALTLVLTLAAPLIVQLYASTMSAQWYRLTVIFAFWCLPQIFFYGLYAVLGQILNAYEKFGPYMWSPALNNVVAIAGLALILSVYGPEDSTNPSAPTHWLGMPAMLLGGISTLGIVVQAVILFWPLYRIGIRFRPDFQWRNSGLGAVGRAGSWVLGLMLTGMIPIMVLLNVAAGATQRALDLNLDTTHVAGNFMYTIAFALYSLPSSLITISIVTAVFPRMSRAAARMDLSSLREDISLTIRTVGVFNVLATVMIFVLAVPVAKVVTPTATPQEAWALAWVLCSLSLGLITGAADLVLIKVFYAFEDTKTAFLTTLPVQIFTTICYLQASFLPPEWTVVGLSLVSSAENLIILIIHFLVLRRRLGRLDGKQMLRSHLYLVLLGAATGVVGYFVTNLFDYSQLSHSVSLSITAIIVGAIVMSTVFVGALALMRLPESETLLRPVRRIFRKVAGKIGR